MNPNPQAVFFDIGNTLQIKVEEAAFQGEVKQQLASLVGARETPEAFFQLLTDRQEAYKKQAKGTLLQVSEMELWTRWVLPDYPAQKIAPLAGQLTRLWLTRNGRVAIRPGAKEVVAKLSQRGYHLGVISNALSETQIPEWLEANDLAPYFKAVVLSSRFGRRKPDRHIYLEAAYLIGCHPQHCVYVGDNPNRDIKGAQQAGFGMTVILAEPATQQKDPDEHKYIPDATIHKLTELLSLFPPL